MRRLNNFLKNSNKLQFIHMFRRNKLSVDLRCEIMKNHLLRLLNWTVAYKKALPKFIMIETTAQCNRRCSYCPNSKFDRSSQNNVMAESLYIEKYKNTLVGKNIRSDILDCINNEFATRLISLRLHLTIDRILYGYAVYVRSAVYNIFKLYLRPRFFNPKYFLVSLTLLIGKRLSDSLLSIYRYIRGPNPKPKRVNL